MMKNYSCIFVVILLSLVSYKLILVRGQNTTNQTVLERRLRIAIPVREFNEFVKIKRNVKTGEFNFSGFSIEVFKAAAETAIPSFPYDFVPFAKADGTMNGTFDDMLKAVFNKEYDGAVGEITILYYRMQWVDFTLPYLDKEISMLVTAKYNEKATLSPVAITILVVTTVLCVYIFAAAVFWILKVYTHGNRGINEDWTDWWKVTVGLLIILFAMVLLVMVAHYMPQQTSALTPQSPSGSIDNYLNQLIRKEAKVGFRQGGFIKNMLLSKGLLESQLVELDSEEEMTDKLQKGSEEGGIDAVVAGIHELKLFQAKDCSAFTLVPTFNLHSGGLGFAFQKESQLVSDFSEGIIKLIDNGELARIQDTTIGSLKTCQDETVGAGSSIQDSLCHWLPVACTVYVTILLILLPTIWCWRWRRL